MLFLKPNMAPSNVSHWNPIRVCIRFTEFAAANLQLLLRCFDAVTYSIYSRLVQMASSVLGTTVPIEFVHHSQQILQFHLNLVLMNLLTFSDFFVSRYDSINFNSLVGRYTLTLSLFCFPSLFLLISSWSVSHCKMLEIMDLSVQARKGSKLNSVPEYWRPIESP